MLHNEKTAPARAASSNAYAPNNKYGVDFQAFNQRYTPAPYNILGFTRAKKYESIGA